MCIRDRHKPSQFQHADAYLRKAGLDSFFQNRSALLIPDTFLSVPCVPLPEDGVPSGQILRFLLPSSRGTETFSDKPRPSPAPDQLLSFLLYKLLLLSAYPVLLKYLIMWSFRTGQLRTVPEIHFHELRNSFRGELHCGRFHHNFQNCGRHYGIPEPLYLSLRCV